MRVTTSYGYVLKEGGWCVSVWTHEFKRVGYKNVQVKKLLHRVKVRKDGSDGHPTHIARTLKDLYEIREKK